MAKPPYQNRRKTLVINKPLQGQLILKISLFPTLALAATTILLSIFCQKLTDEALVADVELPSLVPLFITVMGFVLVSVMFLLYNALKISHRIAGPIYRICQSIKRIREGDVAFKIALRTGDHLEEVRDELNLLLDFLNENPGPGLKTRDSEGTTTAPEKTTASEEPAMAAATGDDKQTQA